ALKNNRINGTLTIGSSHSNQLQLIDLQNNSIEGFTLQADYSVQIIVSVAFLSSLIRRTQRQLKTARLFPALQIEFPAQAGNVHIPTRGHSFSGLLPFPTDPNDFAAIQSLKDIWDHVPPNWSGDDPCGDGWSGISCINNRVVSITLASINLSGQLSSDIAKLAELQTLDLSYNEGMTGPLPPAIGNLAKLTSLILVGCGFSGQIPPSIGSLQQLVILAKEELAAISDLEAGSSATEWYSGSDLKDNGEHTNSGQLPVTLFSLSQLQTVALKNNRINGTLTIGSSHSNQLQLIDLQNNSIEGFTLQADYSVQIIVSVAFLSSLIRRTQRQLKTARLFPALQIEFPAQAGNVHIPTRGHSFSGLLPFPTDPNDFAAIQSLKDIWDHVPPNWSGDDPCGDGWSGISCINNRVVSITLASINLSGQLSSDIAKLAELQTLDLSYNEGMTGPLPPAIGNLANNKLNSRWLWIFGSDTPSIGSLQQLVILAKEELAAISDLEAGSSATEWYSGSDLKNLCVTAAAHCAIREILERLGTRFLSNNVDWTFAEPNWHEFPQLCDNGEHTNSGQLPVTLFSLSQLQTVALKNNRINGTLTIGSSHSNQLQLIDLQNNSIEGFTLQADYSVQIIVSVAFLSSLIRRTQRQLKTARLFPALQIEFPAQAGNVHIPTRGHSFSGLLPFPTDPNDFAAIQSLKDIWDHVPPNWSGDDPCGDGWSGISCINNRVVSITLASINLSGQLSSDIAKLAELQTLDLSYNEGMTGPLPAIGNLAKLTSLYPLHRISATAGIPMILAKEELAAISDLEAGSSATEWYSGSDLKNLCVTAAAHCAIREILEIGNKCIEEQSGTLTIGSSHSNQLQLIDLQNNSIEGFTLQADYSVQIIVSVAFLSSLIRRTQRQLKTARLFPALQIEFPAQAGNVHIPTRGHSFSGLLPFPTDPNDFAAIQSLKDIWDHVPPNWSGDDPCGDGWSGISCINNRVVSITLASINLSGQLSSDIAKLAELQTLDLSYNEGMTGPLPPAIGNLAKLTSLYPLHRISATAGIPMILAKEELAAISDLEAGSSATEWYSGSDLKNLCVTAAAHCAIREILEMGNKVASEESESAPLVLFLKDREMLGWKS
ncbi:UNVERIFIED_CONTAM: hypothetical protein Slati_4398400, partial [Sesamum latifolium]